MPNVANDRPPSDREVGRVMSETVRQTIDAVLEQLTSQEKRELMERLARSLRPAAQESTAVKRLDVLRQLRQELAALPVHNPADGFAGRDHDQALYGDRS